MHLLLHMPRYVKDWGAPWASSAFTYEHGNGLLVRLFNGTQNVIDQIFRYYELSCYIEQTALSVFNERLFESSTQLFNKLVYNDRDIKKCTHENQNLIVLGIAESYTPSPETVVRIENCLDPNLYVAEDLGAFEIKVYHRFIWKNVLYSTTLYNRLQRRNNSTLKLNDGRFMILERLLCLQQSETKIFLILGRQLTVSNDIVVNDATLNISSSAFLPIVHDNHLPICCKIEKIDCKCIQMIIDESMYVSPLTNRVEKD